MGNPIKIDDLGVPPFQETTKAQDSQGGGMRCFHKIFAWRKRHMQKPLGWGAVGRDGAKAQDGGDSQEGGDLAPHGWQ